MSIGPRIAKAVAILLSASALTVFADPIKVVIAFPPGGTSTASNGPVQDYLARQTPPIALQLDYHAGAGGNVAANFVLKAPADGDTLFYGHAGPLAINHHILEKNFFDPQKEFIPVRLAVDYPIVITIQPSLPVKTLKQFVTYAQAHSGKLVFGSSGNGSYQHLSGEAFSARHKFRLMHVPFAGGGPLQQSFLDGKVQVLFETGSNVVKHVQSGRMRALAVLAKERLPVLPDVPTVAEAGLPAFESAAWFGYLARAGTPPEIVQQRSDLLGQALADPEVTRALVALGARVRNEGGAAFARFIQAEDQRLGAVVKAANIRPD